MPVACDLSCAGGIEHVHVCLCACVCVCVHVFVLVRSTILQTNDLLSTAVTLQAQAALKASANATNQQFAVCTWKVMGANGRASGVLDRVALFKMAESRPPMASTLPAGTLCSTNCSSNKLSL